MPNYHKRRRKRFHILKKMIVGMLMILDSHLEHHDKEHVKKFIHFLNNLYE